MAHLSRNEGINQSALADILEIEPITLVHQLDRLESGRLDRAPARSPTTAGCGCSTSTELGRRSSARCRKLGLETKAEAVIGLTTAEQDALIDTLTKIKTNLSARESASQVGETGGGDGDARPRARRQRAGVGARRLVQP